MKTIFTRKGQPILVDDEDYENLNKHTWRLDDDGYAVCWAKHPLREGKDTSLRMHRVVMGLTHGDRRHVDHKCGIKTDNRKSELRICTPQQNRFNVAANVRNKSGYKGVVWIAHSRRWRARICRDGKIRLLGYFATADEAHAAYCRAAQTLHGEFAHT